MADINIDIRFEGSRFVPSKLIEETGIALEILAEYGKQTTIGRYKNQPSPYGMAILRVEGNGKQRNDINESLMRSLDQLLKYEEQLTNSNVEEIIIDIDAPSMTEAEFNLDTESLQKIAQLKARIELHTFPEVDYDTLLNEFLALIESKFNSRDKIVGDIQRNKSYLEEPSSEYFSKISNEKRYAILELCRHLIEHWRNYDSDALDKLKESQ